jgi:hypothetical protein
MDTFADTLCEERRGTTMSKPTTPTDSKKEKTGEIKSPKTGGAPHANAPTTHSSGGGAPSKSSAVGTKLGCHAQSCKEKDVRLSFCEEHFRQFKFGLINKTGDKVLDWEKKFEHYQRWLKAQKVA